MEKRTRQIERYGRVWRPPQARNRGPRFELLKWKLIRDGLRDCIEYLPLSERSLEFKLQGDWIEAARMVEELQQPEGGVWLIPS